MVSDVPQASGPKLWAMNAPAECGIAAGETSAWPAASDFPCTCTVPSACALRCPCSPLVAVLTHRVDHAPALVAARLHSCAQ